MHACVRTEGTKQTVLAGPAIVQRTRDEFIKTSKVIIKREGKIMHYKVPIYTAVKSSFNGSLF